MGTVTDQRRQHVKELFGFAKGALVNTIRGSKSDTQLTPAETSAVAKIQSIDWDTAQGFGDRKPVRRWNVT